MIGWFQEGEEQRLREEYGYTDREIAMVVKGRRMGKAAEELIAMAAQDSLRRKRDGWSPPQDDAQNAVRVACEATEKHE